MSQGPSGHKSMSSEDRVQNCLSGCILLDLFRTVADRECSLRGLPRALCFWPQKPAETHRHQRWESYRCVSVGA